MNFFFKAIDWKNNIWVRTTLLETFGDQTLDDPESIFECHHCVGNLNDKGLKCLTRKISFI